MRLFLRDSKLQYEAMLRRPSSIFVPFSLRASKAFVFLIRLSYITLLLLTRIKYFLIATCIVDFATMLQ